MSQKRICQFCRIVIQAEESFYNCRVEFVSGFDGIFSDSFGPDTAIRDAIEQLDGLSPQETVFSMLPQAH